MPTVCREGTHQKFEFQQAGRRKVQAGFGGGQITSDGGALLLREVTTRSGMLQQLADCLVDHRNPARITHDLQELLAQRVLGLDCGYEDLNDHDQLRADPMWGLLAGKAAPEEAPIASKSTLNRLEAAAAVTEPGDDRYRKFAVNTEAFEGLFARWYVAAHSEAPPARVILDLDATDTPLHGGQEGTFFHGYYDHYCYLPLYVFAGQHLLWAELRRSDIDPAAGAVGGRPGGHHPGSATKDRRAYPRQPAPPDPGPDQWLSLEAGLRGRLGPPAGRLGALIPPDGDTLI